MPANESPIDELEWVSMTSGPVDGSSPTITERSKNKFTENPFIPIGLLATTAFLAFGLRAMSRGDSVGSQRMMRGRVVAQGCTLVALASGLVMSSTQNFRERYVNKDNGGK